MLGLVLATVIAAPAVAGADVSVNVNIGPPPMYVVPPAPALVVVPGTPVYYAPAFAFNFFSYGGRYYTFHNGHWYHRHPYGKSWIFVPPTAVPGPVLGVPVGYYKIPPGHWGRGGPPPGHWKRGGPPPGHWERGGPPPGHHGGGGKRGKKD
jgi:hypothetical protein